jgi:hypothetical protein
MYKGQLTGFPLEVVEIMMQRQEEQGNARDASVFENDKWEDIGNKGFSHGRSIEGSEFWQKVIAENNFDLFFKKYPKKAELTYPRVMMVSNRPITKTNKGIKKEVYTERLGKYVAWKDNNSVLSEGYYYAAEIEKQDIIKLTIEQVIAEVAAKYDVDPDLIKIVKK